VEPQLFTFCRSGTLPTHAVCHVRRVAPAHIAFTVRLDWLFRLQETDGIYELYALTDNDSLRHWNFSTFR
jgi:hypothetical protein